MAEFLVCLHPPLMAKAPPVKKPAMMAFHESSLLLMALTEQSKVENNPPQTPKFPPTTGALALIALMDPYHLSPYGELRNPLIPCQTQPPMTPMEKAPPKSFNITIGHGSLVWSADVLDMVYSSVVANNSWKLMKNYCFIQLFFFFFSSFRWLKIFLIFYIQENSGCMGVLPSCSNSIPISGLLALAI